MTRSVECISSDDGEPMLRWEDTNSYSGCHVINGYSGKAVIFKIYWDDGFYRLQAFLPGYKEEFTKKDDRDIIMKIYAETIFVRWLKFANLTEGIEPQKRGETDNG